VTKGVDKQTGKSPRFKDRTGQRNGRLVFTQCLGPNKHKHQVWEARCDCGNVTRTATPHKTQSCGCLHREKAGQHNTERKLSPEEKAKRRKEQGARKRAKMKSNPVAVMQARLSRLHRLAISQVGALKTSSTFAELGYTPQEFADHIEKQFTKGMGWHNMDQWQIDHIIPVSRAESKEDVKRLNQLPNLRPMWATENNRKRDKVETIL